MSDYLTVGQAAQQLGIPPRKLTDLIYRRVIDADLCPLHSGRRLVPTALMPTLVSIVRDRGLTS